MRHPNETEPPGQLDDDQLDEALEESFPASDPLARWSGIDRDPRRRNRPAVADGDHLAP